MNREEKIILNKLNDYFDIKETKVELIENILRRYFTDSTTLKLTKLQQRKILDNALNSILNILGFTFYPIEKIDSKNPIIVANHIGLGKIFKFNMKLVNDKFKRLINDDPFHFLLLSSYLICKKHNLNQYCVFTKFQYPVYDLLAKLDFIQIDRFGKGNYPKLKSKVSEIINNDKNAAICIFPESGTTGKRNVKSIYSLEEFKLGFLNLSKDLNLNIISSCQVYTKEGHLVVKYTDITQKDYRVSMQKNIDSILHEDSFNQWI